MTYDEWFDNTYPDDAATLKMYEEGSPGVSYFDTIVPSRMYSTGKQAWDACAALKDERIKELETEIEHLRIEDDNHFASKRYLIDLVKANTGHGSVSEMIVEYKKLQARIKEHESELRQLKNHHAAVILRLLEIMHSLGVSGHEAEAMRNGETKCPKN